jgi:shikimate kinase
LTGEVCSGTMRNIVLFGFMGAGKTAAGKEVARRLGMKFVDMDDVIEEKEGCSISDIFAEKGEPYFREVESAVARSLSRKERLVIATGGGVVLDRTNVDSLQRSGTGIWLQASPETVYERVKHESHRPLLMTDNPLKKIRSLLRYREPFYRKVNHRIDTSVLTVAGVAEEIIALVESNQETRAELPSQAEGTPR